jgi:hypothetical protein
MGSLGSKEKHAICSTIYKRERENGIHNSEGERVIPGQTPRLFSRGTIIPVLIMPQAGMERK